MDEHLDAARSNEAIEDQTDAARNAGRDRLGEGHDRAKEAKEHGEDASEEDDFGRGDFGDADNRDVFPISRIGRAAEAARDRGGNPIAD